jgi:D-methionine transport system substrate-binding protein
MKNLKSIAFITKISLFILLSSSLFASTIKVGVITNFDYKLVEFIKDESSDLKIKIIKFDNTNDLNQALVRKEIDVNLFQTLDSLNNYNLKNKSDLKVIVKGYIEPLGIYSKHYSSIKSIKMGDLIAISDEVSSVSRSLKFLSKVGLLELSSDKDLVTKDDISKNYFNVKIVEVPNSRLPRFLEFADYVVLSGDTAFSMGYLPKYDSLYLENFNPKYTNVVVARKKSINEKKILEFKKKIEGKETKLFILGHYEDNIRFL